MGRPPGPVWQRLAPIGYCVCMQIEWMVLPWFKGPKHLPKLRGHPPVREPVQPFSRDVTVASVWSAGQWFGPVAAP